MRILQVSSAQAIGGGEGHVADLANRLAARGHDLYAALRPNSPLIEKLSGLGNRNIVTLPLRNAFDVVSARSLARLVRDNGIEIVHAHMARDYPLASYAVKRNPNARLIITRHVLFALNRFHFVTLARARRIIAVSEAVARQLRAQKLVPPDKITVISNGVDITRFEAAREPFSREKICQRWKIPGDRLLVGTVGELKPLKGQEDFLRAAAIVARRYPNVDFVIAGEDSSPASGCRKAIEELVLKLGLENRVHLLGWLDDVAPLNCALDIFVSASRTESFGLAIAEAMASRTPVVATATEGAREIFEDGRTGLLVPIGDVEALATAVSYLLEAQTERERLGNLGHEVVGARFGLERMVDATERIYRESLR